MLKCITTRPFEDEEVEQIFKENADITLTNANGKFTALTYENFAVTSRKHQMFSVEATNRFMGVESAASVQNQLTAIKANLDYNIAQLEWRYSLGPNFSANEDEIVSRLEALKEKIEANENPEMLLLAYKLTSFESKQVAVDAEVELLLPTLKAITIPIELPKSPRRLHLE